MSETNNTTKIVPHSAESKWDILRSGGWTYIVRNDLDTSYYMKLDGLNDDKPEAATLWSGMKGGLHFVGYHSGSHYKYAIDKTQYWRVTNIQDGPINSKTNLHADFKNREHYLQRNGYWYGIDVTKGLYWKNSGGFSKSATKITLRSDIKGMKPIAMWANGDYFYVLTMDANNLPVVKRTTDFEKRNAWTDQYLSAAMMNFLPGGPSNLHGSAEAKWVWVEGIINSDSDEPQNGTHTRKVTQGYNSTTTDSLENNWKISSTISSEASAGIGADTLKESMSLTSEFGGSEIHTTSTTWSVSVEDDTEMPITAPPRGRVDVYQAIVSNGDLGTVLYGPWDITYGASTDSPKPPTTEAKDQFLR